MKPEFGFAKIERTMNALKKILAAGLVTVGTALPGWGADVTHAIASLQITNDTGYVIDADGRTLDPAYNREHLLVESRVETSNTGGNTVLIEYQLRYRLLDSNGQPHPLYDSSGTVSPDGAYSLTNAFGIAAGVTLTKTNVAALRPAARLSPYETYTVELRVIPPGLREADSLATAPHTFYHFTNLVSNDPGFNLIATVDDVQFSRLYAVQTDPDKNAFQAEVQYTLRRYDNFLGDSLPADNVPVTLTYQLMDATTGATIPLVSDTTNFTRSVFNYDPPPPSDPIQPLVLSGIRTIAVQPAPGQQLDSVDHNYQLMVTISHLEEAGALASEKTGNTRSSPESQLLHFNGTLRFGVLDTTFASIDNDPIASLTVPGSHVATTLGVDNQSGSIPGLPGVTYGDGTDLDVQLLPNGDAVSLTDEVPVNLPPGGPTKVENVKFELVPPAFLTPDGLISGVRVYLPIGTGYRTDTLGHVLRRSFLAFNVPLGSDLRPLSDVTFSPPSTVYMAQETKPLWIETSSIVWRISEGRFEFLVAPGAVHHVRSDEYSRLEAVHDLLDNSQRSLKRSNDRFYEAVQTVTSPVVIAADSNCVGQISLELALGPGEFRTHFPYDARVQWNGSGTLQVVQDQVVPGSQLAEVGTVALSYGTDCPDVDCGLGGNVRTMRLAPADGLLQFTRDGGLVGGGALETPHRLQWGYIAPLDAFAHEAFTFTEANFLMPGHFMRGDQTDLSIAQRGPALLYTGVAATNTAYLERPDLPGTQNEGRYELGFADYAGMNLAVGLDGARQGQSTLAGTPTGEYQLKGISKYYARRGGVSGIHDAVSNTFPATLTLYGYQFDFADFGLNFLDNGMGDSLINGLIDVPFPSEFTQEFAGLRINCLGGIEGAPMPEPSLGKPLVYWNGSFDALALQFRRDPEEVCNVTNAFLTLGVRTQVAHVPETLYGTLGFLPSGDLLPRAIGPEDIDSRLKLPNVIRVAGPAEEEYFLNPVLDVYFNSYDQLSGEAPPVGWVNLAGSMDVPFFEDLRVHVQTSANGGSSNTPIYMLGGWPSHGWESAPGVNYFSADYFDDVNRGYAESVSPEAYRNSPSESFHPRATRTWLKVIPFDYPLDWSFATRSFRSHAPKVHDLMVLSTENELKYLSAANAEITFGAQFDGLPQFNLANLAFQAIDAATAAGNNAMANALSDVVGGFGRMDEMLASDLDPFFDGIFDETIQPKIDEFYNKIHNAYVADPIHWKDQVGALAQATFQTDTDSIAQRLLDLAGNSVAEPGMMKRLEDYLAQAETAVAQVQAILAEDPAGNRMIAMQLMKLLVDNLAAQFAAGFLDEIAQPILAEADPTLDEITLTLANLGAALEQIRTTLADPVGGMGTELQNLFAAHAPEINATIPAMTAEVGDFVNDIDLALDSPIEDYSPEEFTQLIRSEIEDQFYGTPLAAAIQVVHKHRLYDADAAIRQATDTLFQELNSVIRSVISETAEELNNAFTEFLEPLDSIAAAAKINGYAHINGDSLKEARVDLHAHLEAGATLEFNAYLQVKELDSQGSPGCAYAGADSVTEVSFGADDVQIGWISPELRASIGTKFTFDDGGDHFPVRGMGGSFELTGKLDYEAFAINYLGAAIAFGADENYISGAAGMRVNKYDVFGGIYFGRSCTLDPIQLWDPEVASLLGAPPFTGIYGYGEGWIPVNELIGIPASCLFNICAGLGMGAGVFLEGPTFVAKMKAGVSGEALCLVNIKGELTGTGVLEGLDANVLDGLTVKAKGTVGGKVGPCPFCLGLEQSVALTFKQGKWKLDF
jgi:hypothetical protein